MARTIYSDSKGKYIIVQPGDTLSELTVELKSQSGGKTQDQLEALNNITHPKKWVFTGDKFYITGTSSSSNTKKTTSTKTTITGFGLSAADDSSNTLFAVWETTRPKDRVEKFEYEWRYTTGDVVSGKSVWYIGASGTKDVDETNAQWDIPTGAKTIMFRVKPVSKTYETGSGNDKKNVEYFTNAAWVESKKYYTTDAPPGKPEGITVEIDHDRMKLKVEINDINLAKKYVNIQAVVNDKTTLDPTKTNLQVNDLGYVSTEFDVTEGNRYKVRCCGKASKNAVDVGDWSDFTANYHSRPSTPTNLRVTPSRKTSTNRFDVYLDWDGSVTAKNYTIEYVGVVNGELQEGELPNFDAIGLDNKQTETVPHVDDPTTGKQTCTINNIDSGLKYYFRIRADLDEQVFSKWLVVPDAVVIGTPPGPPTTWSSSTSVSFNEPLYLYWTHSSTDGSSETQAHVYIEIYEQGVEGIILHTIEEFPLKSTDYYEKDKTSFYKFDTNPETNPWLRGIAGVKLRWRVQTAGVTGEFGNDPNENWSQVREIDIYAPPELTFTVQPHNDMEYNTDFVCTSFPLSIYAFAGPSSQTPRSYFISISSNDIYETVDNVGNNKTVSIGEVIYSKYIDNETVAKYDILPSDVNLDNNISYKVECVVSMSSGLTTSKSMNFTVNWSDEAYEPWAQIIFDPETLVANIHPYCEEYTIHYYKVSQSGAKYLTTDESVAVAWGTPATTSRGKPIYTTTGERVYSGITTDADGNFLEDEFYYYEVKTGQLIEGITLSVYRREFDGRFTEIATGIDNTKNTFVTDPHPALDYARYRIVAVANDTGAVSYADLPGVLVGETGIILQWAEDWSSFDVDPDVTDSLSKPNWAGSLLRLPYNVDVSPSYGIDTTLIEYAGRQHPVSYYGTQLGESATWSTVIPKTDKETIYALRRLAKWTGDVYAREPSGMGYWANVTVQFPQKHLDKTVPVTLTLTRVEGGM